MASNSDIPERPAQLRRGDYGAPSTADLRSPCPIVNALANHGYIPRDGRNVRSGEMYAAMAELGASCTVRATLTFGSYYEHHDQLEGGFWDFIRNPLTYVLGPFGLRDVNQRDSEGVKCLNLNQLARHDAVEHDVSLSRRDHAQGDNCTSQKDLVATIVSSSTDSRYVSTTDFAALRVHRLQQQKQDNPSLNVGRTHLLTTSGQVAFLQTLFGGGFPRYRVPVSYMKALFEEERLPVREGWSKRVWISVGFLESLIQTQVLRRCIKRILRDEGLEYPR